MILIIAAVSNAYAFYSAESAIAVNSFSLSKIYRVDFDPGEGTGSMPGISIASTGPAAAIPKRDIILNAGETRLIGI